MPLRTPIRAPAPALCAFVDTLRAWVQADSAGTRGSSRDRQPYARVRGVAKVSTLVQNARGCGGREGEYAGGCGIGSVEERDTDFNTSRSTWPDCPHHPACNLRRKSPVLVCPHSCLNVRMRLHHDRLIASNVIAQDLAPSRSRGPDLGQVVSNSVDRLWQICPASTFSSTNRSFQPCQPCQVPTICLYPREGSGRGLC